MRNYTFGLFLLLVAGCAVAPGDAPDRGETASAAPPAATAAPPGPAASPVAVAAPEAAAAAPSAAAAPAATGPAHRVAGIPAAKAAAPAAARNNTLAAASKPAAAPATPVAARPAQVKPAAAPALDLSSLTQRLRDTRAIGLFTKLSLKNQVDDLLGQFRSYYRGKVAGPSSALRQRYDLLMLKVLTLLQDSDPPLAADIRSSREAIWGILNDPAKLTAI